ncbi:MAG: hypothetical protein WBO24_06645 [Nitrospirales bacterium]
MECFSQKLSPDQLGFPAVTTDIRPRQIEAFWHQLGFHLDVLLDEQEELSQTRMARNLATPVIVDTHGQPEPTNPVT